MELCEYLNRDICQPEGFDAYGYPFELFHLDMERIGIKAVVVTFEESFVLIDGIRIDLGTKK